MYNINDEVVVWYDVNDKPVRGTVVAVKTQGVDKSYRVAISGYTDTLSFYDSELNPDPFEDE